MLVKRLGEFSLSELDEMLDREEFGFYLRSMRSRLGYRMSDVADVLGLPVGRYRTYEAGEFLPHDWQRIYVLINREVKLKFDKDPWSRYDWKGDLSIEDFAEIERLYHLGYNVVKISVTLSIDESDVTNHLKRLELKPVGFNPHLG